MKRAKRLFEAFLERDNWRLAWLKAVRRKSRSAVVLAFRERLDVNLEALRSSFSEGSFDFGRYEYFTISDPKERTICAAPFPERIAQHALMNVLDPVFESYQVSDSYACRRGKGTRAAVLRAWKAVETTPYFLKMDVRKFFASIDHRRLKSMLRRRIGDDRILAILDRIIDSYEVAPDQGIPIGNLTSQYFANHYLGLLDHEAKERWRLREWLRYMDDILICSESKNDLGEVYRSAKAFCAKELALELKPAVIDTSGRGAPFLGFLIKPSGIFLTRKTRRRFERKYRGLLRDFEGGGIGESEFGERATAMCAHIDLARARSFRYALFHGARPPAAIA